MNEKLEEDCKMVYLIDCDKFRNRVKKEIDMESEQQEEPEMAFSDREI